MLGNDLVLTIGLPLVAGLSLREFTGVLAHEFGHFAQGTGMRLTYVVRMTSAWLERVVYHRDRLDEWLVRWSRGGDIRIMIILSVLRLGIGFTRIIMWFFMKAGELVSCFMLRQMEYDADRYETRMAGCAAFKSTALKLPVLNVAANGAYADLTHAWADKRLADNFPLLIIENQAQVPEELIKELHKHVLEEETSLLATHPADADRIASSAKENTEGVFQLEGDARVLFSNFDSLCRKASFVFYEAALGEPVSRKQLIDTGEIVDREKRRAEGHKALSRYFMEIYAGDHPPLVTEGERERFQEGEADAMLERLRSSRAVMEEMALGLQSYFEATGTREGAMVEIQTHGGGLARWQDKSGSPQSRNAKELLEQFERHSRIRFLAGLALAREPGVQALLPTERGKLKAAPFRLAILIQLGGNMEIAYRMRKNLGTIESAIEAINMDDSNQAARNRALRAVNNLYGHIDDFYRGLRPIRFPYTHGQGDISVGDYACDQRPSDPEDFGGICSCAGTMLDRFFSLYFRIFGELVLIAEAVEEALENQGLEPQVAESAAPEPEAQDLSQLYPPLARECARRHLTPEEIVGDPEENAAFAACLARYSAGIADAANPLSITSIDWEAYSPDAEPADLASAEAFRHRLLTAINQVDPATEGLQHYVELLLNLSAFLPRVQAIRGALPDPDLIPEIHAELCDLDARLLNVAYPFAEPGVTLADFAIDRLPDAADSAAVHACGQIFVSRTLDLHKRVLGGLCALAESVEAALEG
jgi:hypothetical protein